MRDSPWQIPDVKTTTARSLDGAGEFGRDATFPRKWGAGTWKLLRLAMDGKSKRLKAHEYLVMIRTSLLAVLAAWPRDDNSKNPFAPLIGKLTTIIRELTSEKIRLKVRFREKISLQPYLYTGIVIFFKCVYLVFTWPFYYRTCYGHVGSMAVPVTEYGHTLVVYSVRKWTPYVCSLRSGSKPWRAPGLD